MADFVLMGREEQHRLVRCSPGSLSRLHNHLEMIPCCGYQYIRRLQFRDAPVSGTVAVVPIMDKCPSVKLEMEYITRNILALVSGKTPDLYAFDIQRLGPVLPRIILDGDSVLGSRSFVRTIVFPHSIMLSSISLV